MSGVTDAPFRRQVANQGAGLVISEMTACAALANGKRNAALRVKDHGAGLHVVQLAGCEARWMAEGARMAEDAGAAVIDINMGCPAKHVTNGESGSALMRDLDHALTLIDAVVQAVKVPVTLKMRLTSCDAGAVSASGGSGGVRAGAGREEDSGAGRNGETTPSGDGNAYVTDEGHHILDCSFGRIDDPAALARVLSDMPGVMEHGLFIGMASVALIGKGEEVIKAIEVE